MAAQTMFEKIWESHLVYEEPGQSAIIYIDLHLIHEVTSPQAFDGLRMTGHRKKHALMLWENTHLRLSC